jgi:hypothetical protein
MNASNGERAMGREQLFSVFFPSLSRDILWKAGAVSRVRFAAQTSRALDTAPTFQQILLRRKRREGLAAGAQLLPTGAASLPRPNSNPGPADLVRAKTGLEWVHRRCASGGRRAKQCQSVKWTPVEKSQAARKRLRELFQIDSDPFKPFRRASLRAVQNPVASYSS